MPQVTSELAQWIPLISTLSGAIIALVATFGAAHINHSKQAKIAKEQRQRDRLETIYHSLILIDRQYVEQLTNILNVIDGYPQPDAAKQAEIPPIFQLEMHINLYFKELKKEHNDFIKAKDNFGSLKIKTLTGEIRTMSPETLKCFKNNIIDASELVGISINKIREKIFKIAKA